MARPEAHPTNQRFRTLSATLLIVLAASPILANGKTLGGKVSDNQVIYSRHLGYALQYRVYLPSGYESLSRLPTLYLADGQWYIEPGGMPRLLDKMIAAGKIEPLIAVFLDNRDPANLADNRRNSQFFCNRDYIRFVSEELAGTIDGNYKTRTHRTARTIIGLSFGGLNSACFGLYAHESFQGIAMQSPATHTVPSLFADYENAPARDLKIFLSTGTRNDNEVRSRQFKRILEKKGYQLLYKEVPFGHDWRNWGPLLNDALRYFYARGKG